MVRRSGSNISQRRQGGPSVQPRRINRAEEERGDSSEHLFPMLASETARNAANRPLKADTAAKSGEEKVSVFWRIFGGTILSIAALVVITAYQSVTSSIHELRLAVAAGNEARAELVKKEEHQSSRTKLWDRMQEMQKEVGSVQAPVNQLRDRVALLEDANKTTNGDRRETHELHATIKERLTQFESRLNGSTMTQKDVQMLQTVLSALQEKTTVREQQIKQMEEERKEMLKEIQALRERLVKVEAAKEAAAAKPPARPMPPVPDPDESK